MYEIHIEKGSDTNKGQTSAATSNSPLKLWNKK